MLTVLKRRIVAHLVRRHPHWFLRRRFVRGDYRVLDEREFLALFAQLHEDGTALQSIRELYNLYTYGRLARSVPGDFAEFGVYRGGTARLLRAVAGDRTLHLFDTFEGMPETDPTRDTHKAGDFADTSLAAVQRYVGSEGVRFHPGFFPASTRQGGAHLQRFAFVHLDVDIYQSTLAGLQFFYPRLSPGGILITHDYSLRKTPGVRDAFRDFFAGKPERVLPVWDTQAVVVKAGH